MSVNSAGATALITGVTGQDGYYLSELLRRNGFQVHGVLRAGGSCDGLLPHVHSHYADLVDTESVSALTDSVQPDVVFHLAGISSVAASWQDPVSTTQVNALSTTALLDACLHTQERTGKKVALVNASSGEIFAGAAESPQTETTPLHPISPYGASKALAYMMCQVYRAKGLAASNAILYNHESPRRPDKFVTRKITKAVAAIAAGRLDRLILGDLTVKRDWGWAPDYVDAMYRMAKLGRGDDFVIATGEAHSVADFVAAAFEVAGVDNWRDHVETDAAFMRPADRAAMIGDASKAASVLGWQPTMTFGAIVKAMVCSDLAQEQHT
jgi:GDPmannose 4,6-dehydratase